jgi:hypothetical protein
MPIDEQTIAELRGLYEKATQGPWTVGGSNFLGTGVLAAGMDLVKDGPMLACWRGDRIDADQATANGDLVAAMHAALPALLTAASNEARLQRLYDAQQDLIEDQARKLHTAQMEVDALRARDMGWRLQADEQDEEIKRLSISLERLLGDHKGTWFATHGGYTDFEKLPAVIAARAALTPPAAAEEDAS